MPRARRSDIQGLRAFAVLLVVLAHAGVKFLKGGYVGVDVFFVLSGFLITGLLIDGASGGRLASLVNFCSRRARRILPAAALTLVATDIAAAWYRWALQKIRALHPDAVLTAASFSGLEGATPAAAPGISSLVSQIRSYTKHVLILGDLPSRREQPVDCLLAGDANMARCSYSPTEQQLNARAAIASGARTAGATYVDPLSWFCFDDTCPMVIGHTIAYMDRGHITATYTSELEPVFRAAFAQAIGKTPAFHDARGST